MYRRLGDAKLKNGETVEIGVIVTPDAEYAERLRRLLGHKGWEWIWQMGFSLAGRTDALENRFYVARRGADLISNICTFEFARAGILAHVWTPEDERRKGLCNAIFEKLMADYRTRGGGLMLLGTEFDTPPWHLYRKFGFEAFFEGSGLMRFSTERDFEAKYFAPAKTKVVEPTWSAWPRINALLAEPEEFIKSFAYAKFYKSSAEDAYLYVLHVLENHPGACAKLLESESTGAVVGCAWVVPDKRFPGVHVLDLYCHPNHLAGYAKLLGALKWPAAKVQCYVEAGMAKKAHVLETAGFALETTLKGQLQKRDGVADLFVYSKGARS